MKMRDLGPLSRLQASFVPIAIDASGLCEAEVFAKGSANALRSRLTWSKEEPNFGAMKKAASRSSAGST